MNQTLTPTDRIVNYKFSLLATYGYDNSVGLEISITT
uniref:Uncharacterized protein n=1 Tax=Rhizophora mucronata TaxID=61149 RepID=A0A2P2PX68_RHIMU